MRTGFVQYRGDQVAFSVAGKGRAVVLLHGFLGSREIWSGVSQKLNRSYRMVCVDLPGHGESACYGYVHSMELMAGAVKAVLDHLRLRRYVMIGHSMGGYAALAFAELYPDHLKGLCLFHSTAYADPPARQAERERAVALVRANRRLYAKNTIPGLFAEKNVQYLKEEIGMATRLAASTSRRGIVAALRGMKDRPSRDVILGMATYPVLIVAGEHDKVLPVAQLKEQAGLPKNGSLLLLEHDGHFGFLESPRQSLKALRSFIRRCYRR